MLPVCGHAFPPLPLSVGHVNEKEWPECGVWEGMYKDLATSAATRTL